MKITAILVGAALLKGMLMEYFTYIFLIQIRITVDANKDHHMMMVVL